MKKAKYGSGFKLFDYYKTVARVGGVFSALSLSAMIYVIYYMFYNYIFGDLKLKLATNNALKYSLIAVGIVIALMVVVFVVLKIASRRTSALDVALIVVGVADIVIMVKKFSIDGIIETRAEIAVYAVPLACTVVISIVRWIMFRTKNNKLISTHGEKSNSSFAAYYKDLFKRPSTWFMIVVALVVSLMFVLAQAQGWLDVFELNDSAKNTMITNCAVMGGVAGVLFIIGLAIRLYNKTLNFMDAFTFAIAPAGVIMVISYAIVQHTATLVLAIGALVISAALQIIYAKTSYLTDSIVCDYEDIPDEEEKTEEVAPEACSAPETKEEVSDAIAVVASEHEDYGATLEAVQNTLDRLYKQNVDLEERLEKAEKALAEQAEKIARLEKEAEENKAAYRFVLLDIEKLTSRLSYLETKAGAKTQTVVVKEESGDDKAFVMKSLENIYSRLTYAELLIGRQAEELAVEEEPCPMLSDHAFVMLTLEKLISRLTYAEWLLANGVVPAKETESAEEQTEQEQAEEEVAEEEEAPEDEEAPEEDEEQEETEEAPAEEQSGEITWEEVASNKRRAKPRYTFDMKLRIADDNVKKFYSDIKNALLSYGMHARMSRHKENFNKGRNNIARMAINGKTLKIYLAINPADIDPKYYHHRDVSDKKGVAELPTMINVRSKVAVKKVKMLIDRIAEELVIFPKKYTEQDFAAGLTADGFTTVERKGYGYLVNPEGVAVKEEVDKIPDDFATNAVEYITAPEKAGRFIKAQLSLKELSKHFRDGDVVDIAAVREKGLCAVNANYLAVTESDRLTKKLHVYADEYTVAAAKMICVAGGEAYMILQSEE